jgi:hypothetical protein
MSDDHRTERLDAFHITVEAATIRHLSATCHGRWVRTPERVLPHKSPHMLLTRGIRLVPVK